MVARRTFLSACGLLGAKLALPGCGGGSSATPDGGTDGAPDGGASGTLPIPPRDDGELVDGVRVFRLALQTGTMMFVGVPTATYGVNGAFLGPTLRMRRGERVRVEVTNRLGEPTTLHGHGMHVPAGEDGGPYQLIAPDETWTAEYDVVQRAMTTWYHPHRMHETGRQVHMGIAGLIAVEDPADTPALPSAYGVDDLPLIVQDRRFAADGTHPYSPGRTLAMHDMMAGLRGETMLVNGAVTPRAVVPRGRVRLRILNGSNARNYNFGFADDRSFQLIASDGGLLAAPITTTRVLLSPSERAEIIVDFGADAPGTTLGLRSYSGEVFGTLFVGQMGANLSDALDRTTFDIMSFEVGDTAGTAGEVPASFAPITRMTAADAARTRTIALAFQAGNWFINGTQMTQLGTVPAAIDFAIPAGDIEIWRVTNTSGMAHPFHVHNRHFQVLDIDGQAPPPHLAGWKDTVIVAPGRVVQIIVPFEGAPDGANPFMFHCHILEHEDMGMMGQFTLV